MADLLGHASSALVARRYGHAMRADLDATAEALRRYREGST